MRHLLAAAIVITGAFAQHLPASAQSAYRVGNGDILKIAVWSQPELSGLFTVDLDGSVPLPLIGNVAAASKTVADIERDVRERLANGYLTNPQVTIDVAEYKSQRIFVVGEVRTPGAVPLTGALTLIEALTRVGSLTEFAGGDLLVIRQPEGRGAQGPVLPNEPGAREVLRVDVQQLQSKGPSSNVELANGDTVVVPRAEVIYVIGQVNSPGSYTYERNMTILQVIARASGVNDSGSTRRLKILRIQGGKRVELKAEMSDKVLPGDTVVVSSRWF